MLTPGSIMIVMRSPFLILIAASALAAVAACGASEEEVAVAPSPTATTAPTAVASRSPLATPATPITPGPGVTLWRWVNVTVLVPDGSVVTVGRGTVPEGVVPEGGPGMDLTVQNDRDSNEASYVIIDAATGKVLIEKVAPADRAAIDEVLRTLAVTPFDSAVKSWPYGDGLPANAPRRILDSLSYPVPDPSSGIKVSEWLADPTGSFINVSNGRSTILIRRDSQTGTLMQEALAISPEDKTAFERYFSSVRVCGIGVEC